MKLVPLDEKVVVKPAEADDRTAGGILLPDNAQQKPQQGRVLSVGDGQRLANGQRAQPQVSEGDRILFQRYAGTSVVVEGQELLILSERDILAVLT